MNLETILNEVIGDAKQYSFGKIKISPKVINGSKVGYAGGSHKGVTVSGYIVIDSRFAEYGTDHPDELLNTVRHELSHLIAETLNTRKKGIWHGQAWKDVFTTIGGDGSRYYSGSFVKPENVGKTFKTKAELASTLPTEAKETWERGTYRQWLERGYHVIKGQKGHLQVWQFSANEYETGTDGKTSDWGRASAVYFDNNQVEPNEPKEA